MELIENSENTIEVKNDAEDISNEDAEMHMFKLYLEQIFEKRKNKCYDLEAYALSSYILDHNNDFHVIWNFRREILTYWKDNGTSVEIAPQEIKFREYFVGSNKTCYNDYELFSILDSVQEIFRSGEFDFDKILTNELSFTTKCLTKHLKSYATWHHRTMVIKWMKNPPFKAELKACSDFLTLDARNFHCWNYQKFICELQSGGGFNTQFNFIANMIQKHPDNFSAFHYRSIILAKAKEKELMPIDEPFLDGEFDKIKEILTNLASHQGIWLYFWWLCFLEYKDPNFRPLVPKTFVYRIVLDKSNNTLIYQFNECLSKEPFDELVLISGKQSTPFKIKKWYSSGTISSDIWFHTIDSSEDISEIVFQVSTRLYTVEMNLPGVNSNLIIRTIDGLPKNKFDLIRETNALNRINDLLDHSHKTNSQIVMEENKYFNQTMALLSDKTYFDKLTRLDPLRRNYYLDSKSRQIICEKLKDKEDEPNLNLANLSLTCLQPVLLLTHLQSLDLSNNNLGRINGSFNSLISLKSLILDNNQISFIGQSFKMHSLKTLSLKNNRLTKKSSLKPCNNCEQLNLIIITGNAITELEQGDLEIEDRITIQS